jgi:hypothetical protein
VIEGYADGAPGSVRPIVDGRELLSFCGNDYLGLARDVRVAEAFATAARRWGAGSGASHLVTGHHAEHHALEDELAAFTGRERAVLFSTGYMANLALATTLVGRDGHVLEDRLNHASLLDAGWLSGSPFVPLRAPRRRRGDAPARGARRRRRARPDRRRVQHGRRRRAAAGARAACREHRAWLAVDDAHGLGVLGVRGGGSARGARLHAGRRARAGRHARQGVRHVRCVRRRQRGAGRAVRAARAHLRLHDRAAAGGRRRDARRARDRPRRGLAPRALAAHVARFRAGAGSSG